MKQPIAARIIEFPLKLTMANTSNLFVAFAIVFLASLSLSSAFVNQEFVPRDFQKNFNLELQPSYRQKREENAYLVNKHNSLELEELSDSQTVQDRRAIAEETKKLTDDRKNNSEEDAKDDILYNSMHDLIQAFILADKQDIAMRLQQLREIENATESEKLSNLSKRHASASAAAAAASNLLGANLWEPVPLTDLDAHSCETEAIEYGHVHLSGLVVHEFFCEIRKFWHYLLIIVRNIREGLTLGPLIAEEVIEGGHGILNFLFHHIPRLLHTVIREPHHLLILPDIIRDSIPRPSILGAIHRIVHVTLKVVHFVRELFFGLIRHVFGHFFHLHHIGLHLRERLHEHHLAKLHHLYGYGSIVPCEDEIIGEPVVSTATSAAAAAAASASAVATATATAAASDGGVVGAPEYHRSLADVLSSLRGFYDGYHASGIPHLVRTGLQGISTSSVYSKITSYISNVPSYLTNIGSYLSNIPRPNFYNGFTSLQQGPVETVSSSASASATVTETQPIFSAAPLISAVPNIVSSVPVVSSSGAASAAATAAATSAAAAASAASVSPMISNYQIAPQVYAPTVIEEPTVPCAPVVQPALSSGIVSETIENTVSESSSSSVAVASPERYQNVGYQGVLDVPQENTAAAASASASASLASNVSPMISTGSVPLSLPYSLNRYNSRPILSAVRPASAASASSSASVSSGGNLIEPGQYRGLDLNLGGRVPLIRSQLLPSALHSLAPSSAAAAASAASGGAAAASSASSVLGGLNFVLPRQHIINALGHDYLTPGDLISIALRNKATLIGRVLDGDSPINFHFLRPSLRASLLRQGGRVWNLSPRDFRDPECVRRLNSPLLLRHVL